MLTKCIESIIIFFINNTAAAVAQAKANRGGPDQCKVGLLSRLLGRRPTAPTPRQASDPPVVIGEIIPSAREALRQRDAAPATVSLTTEMRSKHTYIVGKSGMGKTNYNVQLIDADIVAGRSVALIDYRGDLVDRVCRRLAARYKPDEIADRLLLIDLRTPSAPIDASPEAFTIPFNPLTQCGANPYTRAFFVLDIFEQHLGTALGVQIAETLRNCLLALAMTGRTLLDIDLILQSDRARAEILSHVEDTGVLRFFSRFEALNEAQRALWTNPIQNKISPWIASPVLKNLLGGSGSISVQDFLDQRPDAIVLFCAGADEHFGSTAAMMVNLFVHAVVASVMRTGRPSRHNLHLYVDEFQNLSTDKFSEIISEGRRFGLWLTISHQSPSQLEPKLRTLVRNVVGTSLFFGVGGADAEVLSAEIASDEPKTVLKNLLINQKPGEAVLLRQGLAAVRIRTPHAPDPDVSAARVQALRQASLRRHGRSVAEVEADLRAREALFLPPPEQHAATKAAGERTGSARGRRADKPATHKPDSYAEDQYEVRDNEEVRDDDE